MRERWLLSLSLVLAGCGDGGASRTDVLGVVLDMSMISHVDVAADLPGDGPGVTDVAPDLATTDVAADSPGDALSGDRGTDAIGPDSGAPQCAPAPGDTACAQCQSQKCCINKTQCAADPDCAANEECIKQCAGNTTCLGTCEQEHMAGTWLLSGLIICTLNNCMAECGTAMPTCGGITLTGPACDMCVSQNCCAENTACGTSDDCASLVYQCLDKSGCMSSDAPCATSCRAQHPEGAAILDASASCARTKCPVACAGL